METFVPGMLPEEYEDLRQGVAKFADEEVAPVSAELDAKHEFPYDLVAKMGEMGLFGLPFDEEYGGMGGDYFALCLAIEELGRVNQSLAITLEAGVSLGAMPIYRFGTEEQKKEWLPKLTDASGLAAFGLTEPGRIRCRRHPDQGHFGQRDLDDQRQQVLHHELRNRHHPPGHRYRRDRNPNVEVGPRSA